MILFLDVISPKPKFILIDNNKVIESLHILENDYTRISDIILNKFLILLKKYNLLDKIKYLVVCTGPGSYTSLRVGISFMIGLSYTNKIPIYGVSCSKFISQFVSKKDFYDIFIIICSSNNQNYIFFPEDQKNSLYKIININEENSFNNINLKFYSKCISNYNLPDFINKKICPFIQKIKYINFEDKLQENFVMSLENNVIIQPIYISDNKLFD